MPRKPRIVLPGYPVHLIQRGNNRSATFYAEDDYRFYLEVLRKASLSHNCMIHAYVLMTNHVHLLVTPATETGISSLMQSVGRCYVRYINNTYHRTGTLWEGRFKSSLVHGEYYYLACSRYIEMNPVRASMVNQPGNYRWSSFHYNALAKSDPLIQPHSLYLALGHSAVERAQNYQELFQSHIDLETLDKIRETANQNLALCSDQFRAQIEQMLKRSIQGHDHGGDRKSDKFKQTQSKYEN